MLESDKCYEEQWNTFSKRWDLVREKEDTEDTEYIWDTIVKIFNDLGVSYLWWLEVRIWHVREKDLFFILKSPFWVSVCANIIQNNKNILDVRKKYLMIMFNVLLVQSEFLWLSILVLSICVLMFRSNFLAFSFIRTFLLICTHFCINICSTKI